MSSSDDDGRASASALARLVGADPSAFEGAWGRTHLLHHGAGFEDLLDLPAIDELLTTRGLRTPFLRVAKDGTPFDERRFTSGGGVGAAIADQLDDARLTALFADGATLVLQGLHRTWAPVAEFVRDLAAELGHPVQANAYITPPQSQGFSAHYDVHDVFVLQLSGEKRWVIHDPVLRWPMRDESWEKGGRRDLVARAAEGEPALDVVLVPGDCLYLPRGHLHAATALGGVSAHLTLGIHTWTRHHLATDVMRQALTRASDLRAPLPAGVDVGDPTAISQDAAAVRAALLAAVESISDADLAAAMGRRADDSGRPAPVSPLAQAAAVRDLTADSVVRVRAHLRLRHVPTGEGLRLVGRGVDVLLPEATAPHALDTLLDGAAHRVGDLPAAASDLVTRLLAAAVLVPA